MQHQNIVRYMARFDALTTEFSVHSVQVDPDSGHILIFQVNRDEWPLHLLIRLDDCDSAVAATGWRPKSWASAHKGGRARGDHHQVETDTPRGRPPAHPSLIRYGGPKYCPDEMGREEALR